MKRIYMYIMGLALVCAGFVSCEEDDKDPMRIHLDESIKAPFVRINGFQNVVGKGDLGTASFDATVNALEGNVASWEATVSLEVGGAVAAGPVTVLSTTSFPNDVTMTYEEIASALGLTTDDIDGGNVFRFLGTATGTDGRVVTQDNFSASILGQPEQLPAYNFTVSVECSPITDVTVGGTWGIDIFDSFGDGWDGAFLTFRVNGEDESFTITGGSEGNFTKDVPDGAELLIFYTPGQFEGEHTFSLTSPEGPYGDYGPAPGRCVN